MVAETQQFPIADQQTTRKGKARADAVREEADQVRPGETFATVITAVFFSIGWIIGAAWRGVVFCCLAVRFGYRSGAHVKTKAPAQEQGQQRRTRPGPGGTRIIEEG